MLDRVSNIVLGLNGEGSAETFADYAQWEASLAESKVPVKANARNGSRSAVSSGASPPTAKGKLSYMEAREYASIEQRVDEAEHTARAKRAELEDPAIASDGPRLLTAHAEMEEAQERLDVLYARWAELEKKKG